MGLKHSLANLLSLLCVIEALLGAAGAIAATPARPGCMGRCGEVEIPYPFGVGTNCSAHFNYTVTCNTSFTPARPFLSGLNLQVLGISLHDGTVLVNTPLITSGCPDRTDTQQEVNLTNTPFSFSYTANRFTAMGCDSVALIYRGPMLIAGCTPLCNNTNSTATEADSNCYGILCCQTRIPPSLKFINASMRSVDPGNDLEGGGGRGCNYAFMVEVNWFGNLTNVEEVRSMESVPTVLDWRPYGSCHAFGPDALPTNTSAPLCSSNSLCTNQSLCSCIDGYDGNPYLSDGCQDIDECADGSFCEMLCGNIPGSYICYCPSGYESRGRFCFPRRGNSRAAIFTGVGTGLGALILLGVSLRLQKLMKKRKKEILKKKLFKRNGGLLLRQQLSSGDRDIKRTKLFTSKELDKATDHYNENRILGHGGQGTVYKGMLNDGRIVAIKKSIIENDGKVENFVNEVFILSQINHRNVVKLHGCCLETEVPLLVYEFIPNGTLYQYIHEPNEDFPLTWEVRLRVAIEIAGALSYLHSAAAMPIYHRDIKSTNILLDEKYRAKIADFGTSKSISIERTHFTTRVQGTFGYLDPEYFRSSQLTDKSDVYSFGVVLVELLSGQKPVMTVALNEHRSLASYFILAMEENRLFEILDEQVRRESRKEEIVGFANLARECLNLNGRRRLTMKEVATELEVIRRTNGEPAVEQHHQEPEFAMDDVTATWDSDSMTTGSSAGFDRSLPSSDPVRPLLL